MTHDRLGDHYPRDVTFAPPPGVRAAIYGMMGVPDALRDVATSLLARGGEVRLHLESSWLFLEEQPLSPDKSLSVANVPKKESTAPGR